MRSIRLAAGLAIGLAIVACEPVLEPTAETTLDVPAPSFAILNPVVEHVRGSADFNWIQPSTGEEFWRTSSLSARKLPDGSVTGAYRRQHPRARYGQGPGRLFHHRRKRGVVGGDH